MSMVIGKGVIANRFIDYSFQSQYLIFAGCVNDSGVTDTNFIKDEEAAVSAALEAAHDDLTFVYFSSCSILDPDAGQSLYVQHKIRMERLIQASTNKFYIFRLPQLFALSDISSSLVNYLVDAVSNQKHFELWKNAKRNLIDIDDVHDIVDEVLRRNIVANKIINVSSPYQTSVLQLVNCIERYFGLEATYTLHNKGSNYEIDVSEIGPVLRDLKIDFGAEYITKSLQKYFAHLKQPPLLLSVIVPTYNEEHGIEEFYCRTKNVLLKLSPRFEHEIIFVNDYSTDNTFQRLKVLAENDSSVKLINFSRNFGNQIGITAGIDFSRGIIDVVIDDDLQDPPEIILNLIAKWDKGYKVVYGVRPKRKGVNPLFKFAAKMYYRVLSGLSETNIPNDTGDFRLIDRAVIETLKNMKEENRYYRGMVAWVGFPQIGVNYERDKRHAGVSTFSVKKYFKFALNGLTSFTERPLYFASMAGLVITTISFVLALYLITSKIINPSVSIRGWTSLTVIILFFGGIQLLSIGILSVYVSKIYREVKGRPLYIIESTKNLS